MLLFAEVPNEFGYVRPSVQIARSQKCHINFYLIFHMKLER